MRIVSFTRGFFFLVLTGLAVTNARAVCTGSGTTGSFWGYTYLHSSGTNVPSSMLGAFWALGFGNPAPGAGADNGGWALDESTAAAPDGWLIPYEGLDTNFLYGDWSHSQEVDACIVGRIAPGKSFEIMVTAVSDVSNSGPAGMFAAMAVQRNPNGSPDFNFTFPVFSQVELVPIPKPFILSSSRSPGGTVTLTLRGPTLAQAAPGIYTDGSVSAAELVIGYRTYMQSVHAGQPVNFDRRIDSGWILVAQTTPLGQNTSAVLADACDRSVVAHTLVLESGYETPFVGWNSSIIDSRACDPLNDFDNDGYVHTSCCANADCDDSNPAVHPGAAEVCNGIDDDCDGIADGVAGGPDPDADGVQDLCDGCDATYDPNQSDFDHDGQGDACDLDDGLILVGFPSESQVAWQAEAGFIAWNLYRGDLGVLAAGGGYTQQPGSNPLARRDCDLASPQAADTLDPATGRVAFSLVSGETATGEGNLGSDSAGSLRPNTHPCP